MPDRATLHQRAALYLETAEAVRRIEDSDAPEADRLPRVAQALGVLAATPEAFPLDAFPRPEGGVGGLYRLAEFPDQRASLYLSLGVTGCKAAPHTHAAWAAVAGISGGSERNRVYERLDDGSVEGRGRLGLTADVEIGPGQVLLLPSGAFHEIEVISDSPVLHIHAYGRSVDAPGPSLPAFPSADSPTYIRRTPGGFGPAVAVAGLDEARDAVGRGEAAAVVLEDMEGQYLDGPFAVRAPSGRAVQSLEALSIPTGLPVLLSASGPIAPAVLRAFHAAGHRVVMAVA